ncbi:MAG: Uma2 family endonuclease [Kofleriaceae bacterium]
MGDFSEQLARIDQRVFMHVDWSGYEALDHARGECARPRITYLDGVAELMSPSNDHERIKSHIGRLIDAFCLVRGIKCMPFGNWTLKSMSANAAAEADECYVFGGVRKPRPDLAIEVVWTSGGLDKLEVYHRLGVPEVWFWIDEVISVHVLGAFGYEKRPRSACLPELDVELVASLLDCETINESVARIQAFAAGLTPTSA